MSIRKKFFLIKIFVGCCLLQSAVLGLFYNTFGIYTAAICSELQLSTGQFIVCWTIQGLVAAFLLPLAGKIFDQYSIKKIILITAVILCAAQAAMSVYYFLWQFYLSGIAFGISGAFLFTLPIPLMINGWFDDKRAPVLLGIASSSSGIAGVLFSKVVGYIIEQYSWRVCCVVLAGLCFLMCTAASCLLEDYGNQKEDKEEANKKEHSNSRNLIYRLIKDPRFFLVIIIYLACSSSLAFGNHISNHAVSIGFSIAVASTMNSSLMFGNLSGKIIAGVMTSKLGVVKALCILAIACGSGFFLLTGVTENMILVGSCLSGISFSLITVITPVLVKNFFKEYNYTEVLAVFSMLDSLIRSVMSILYGSIFDWTGKYVLALHICMILLMLCLISVFVLKKKYGAETILEV